MTYDFDPCLARGANVAARCRPVRRRYAYFGTVNRRALNAEPPPFVKSGTLPVSSRSRAEFLDAPTSSWVDAERSIASSEPAAVASQVSGVHLPPSAPTSSEE